MEMDESYLVMGVVCCVCGSGGDEAREVFQCGERNKD